MKLLPHAESHVDAVSAIDVALEWAEPAMLRLRYKVVGDMSELRIPQPGAPGRLDGLWKHTCFELFAKGSTEAYCEFNFSPSRQWAAYCFDGYRHAMTQLKLASDILVSVESSPGSFSLEAIVDLQELDLLYPVAQARLGIAAVIEQRNGRLSYWALCHPPGRPDFHHSDGFVLAIPGDGARAGGE
jgi:hypothetical protein